MARAIPSLAVIRPADGNEVVGAYISALKRKDGPTLLALTRHNVPHLRHSSADGVHRGAYTVHSVSSPQIILVASGSEVSIAVDAANIFGAANVVSMPCCSFFDEQDSEYKRSLFPDGIPVMSVEASIAMGWEKYAHAHVAMGGFGASGKMGDLFKAFGFTADNISARMKEVVAHFGSSAPSLHQRLVFSQNPHLH
jgi:transketolase